LRYLPKSDLERSQMLDTIGASRLEDLYTHLPKDVLLDGPLDIAPGKSEYEIVDYFRARGAENANGYASFLGAGVYHHYRPVPVDAVVSRSEFLTSYTPYQAENSQGTLTAIFEFQTMLCQLTGMDVANASMYDGSSAVPEAAMMAARVTNRERILISRSVHPEYREVLRTYAKYQGLGVEEFGYDAATGAVDTADLESKIDDDCRCDYSIAELFRHRREREGDRGDRGFEKRSACIRILRSGVTGIVGATARRRYGGG
jgi:glycine dehydrogenase subunit 1